TGHESVIAFRRTFSDAFEGVDDDLHITLIDNATDLDINVVEGDIRRHLFARLRSVPIVDDYGVYQLFADQWKVIEGDLVILQLDGWEQVRSVEPNIVTKKVDGKDTEVPDGWKGTILPIDLVQRQMMPDVYVVLQELQEAQSAAEARKEELFEEIDEEEHGIDDDCLTTDAGTAVRKAGVTERLGQLLEDVTSPEIKAMEAYSTMSVAQKRALEADHPEYGWGEMEAVSGRLKSGTFGKAAVNTRVAELKKQVDAEEGSITAQLIEAEQ